MIHEKIFAVQVIFPAIGLQEIRPVVPDILADRQSLIGRDFFFGGDGVERSGVSLRKSGDQPPGFTGVKLGESLFAEPHAVAVATDHLTEATILGVSGRLGELCGTETLTGLADQMINLQLDTQIKRQIVHGDAGRFALRKGVHQGFELPQNKPFLPGELFLVLFGHSRDSLIVVMAAFAERPKNVSKLTEDVEALFEPTLSITGAQHVF